MSIGNGAEILEMTADLVAAYVSNNPVPVGELPDLIASVNASLTRLGNPIEAPVSQAQTPAVNPKKSVFPDYIISLENGKRFKSLKRHIGGTYGLTPDQYRTKWDLPASYPMVAPNYSAARSEMAKKIGLGRKRAAAKVAPKAKPTTGAKRGRTARPKS
jgi:predicted transcriptional regulator